MFAEEHAEEHQGLIDNRSAFCDDMAVKSGPVWITNQDAYRGCQCVSAVTPSRSHIWDIFPKKQVVFLQIPLTFPTYFVGWVKEDAVLG